MAIFMISIITFKFCCMLIRVFALSNRDCNKTDKLINWAISIIMVHSCVYNDDSNCDDEVYDNDVEHNNNEGVWGWNQSCAELITDKEIETESQGRKAWKNERIEDKRKKADGREQMDTAERKRQTYRQRQRQTDTYRKNKHNNMQIHVQTETPSE